MSYRERLEGLLPRARTPERRAELEAELFCPPIPPALIYLWIFFQRLNNRRGSNGFGPSPITWHDIEAFARLSRLDLLPWEVETLEALDVLFLNEAARQSRRGAAD